MTTESSNQRSAISGQERRRFFIQTFGCQMNVNDSEKVAGLMLAIPINLTIWTLLEHLRMRELDGIAPAEAAKAQEPQMNAEQRLKT